ncbi:MAG TPA: LysR family transcriptional regulator [Pseudolabrys sp.]|nr:LysR family transcriptional regulator [Pseudolabrys sp.]
MAQTELRLFRYFVTLCEEQNFARAAERLSITPPTLTHQIQKLEKELNVRLLNRKTKMKLQLTEAGARFLESARDVLHRAGQAENTARKAARGEIGRIEIGYMIATTYSGLLQRLIGGFQEKFPGIDITLHQMSTVKLVNAILTNELDAGFARVPTQYPSGLGVVPFSRTPVILALPANHPLARKNGAISPRALAEENFVSTSIGYDLAFIRHVEAVAKLGGFKAKIAKRAEDLTTVLSYVSLGYGIAAVSRDMANCQVPNVVFRKIAARNVPEVMFSFMYRTKESAPAVRALIDAVRGQAAKNEVLRRAS